MGCEPLTEANALRRQYREVRVRDGYHAYSDEDRRRLPQPPPGDPHADEWHVRAESFARLRSLIAGVPRPRVLDAGAGNGWLSNRLTEIGCRVVALDWSDDECDGLGACRHYTQPFPAVRADFDRLPFSPGQFTFVVFNASLHYAPDIGATLAGARRLVAPGGGVVVMDSPVFRDEADGQAMVGDKLRRFREEYGLAQLAHPQVGFLTFDWLQAAAARLGLRGRFFPSRGPLTWRARRELARLRLGRAPSAFGVWVGVAPAERLS